MLHDDPFSCQGAVASATTNDNPMGLVFRVIPFLIEPWWHSRIVRASSKALRHLISEEACATSIKRLVPAGSENVIIDRVLAKLLRQAWSSVACYFSEQNIS
jgi:hypothetical protein